MYGKMVNLGESLVPKDKINKIIFLLNQVKMIDGDYAEVGVYKGGTSIIICENSNSNVYLFDTFNGMPYYIDNVDKDWEIGSFGDIDFEDVKNLFKNQENVFIYKGIFPKDTGKYIKSNKFKFVHLDVDNYTSYKECLEFFYNKMVTGGIVIFGDDNCECCPRANISIDEFLVDKPESLIVDQAVFIIKN